MWPGGSIFIFVVLCLLLLSGFCVEVLDFHAAKKSASKLFMNVLESIDEMPNSPLVTVQCINSYIRHLKFVLCIGKNNLLSTYVIQDILKFVVP